MSRNLKMDYGDEISVFNEKEKVDEWKKRSRKIEEELKNLPEGEKFITFLMKRNYSHSYSLNTKLQYKQTFLGWRTTTVGDLPKFKPHLIHFRLGRVKLYDPEQIAFMDMKEGFIREADRELTPYEKVQKEREELETRVKELESKAEKKEVKNASAKGKAKGKKVNT